MQRKPRSYLHTIASHRANDFAAALLVAAIVIGALGVTPPASQAQQAGNVAPTRSHNTAPPPKATTHPPAEPALELLNHLTHFGLNAPQSLHLTPHNSSFKTSPGNRRSTDFTLERKE